MRSEANERLVMELFGATGPSIDDVLSAYEKYLHPVATEWAVKPV